MKKYTMILSIFLVVGLGACNFDGPDSRKVCAEDCNDDDTLTIGSGAAVAQIDLLNRQDGNKGCPVDFSLQTFDMTAYSGTAAKSFADAAALEDYLKQDTGFTWSYDAATCLLSSTDDGAVSNTIEMPFFENSLAGKVFTDVDPSNGDFTSGDAGIGGVGITLTCGSYVAQTTTNAAGEYNFENIPPGACTVSTDAATRPANHNNSYDQDGNTDHSIPVTVGTTTNTIDHNFGYIPTYTNTLSGVIFRDAQNDQGDLEGADVGIASVTVNLVCGAQSFSTTTDANGAYSFTDLPPGSCTISVDGTTIPSGLTHSYDEDLSIDEVYTLPVGATGAHPGNDFGYVPAVVATINFVNEEDAAAADCALDFAGRTFDMTAFGGTAATAFADVAALEAAIEAAPGGYLWAYDAATCLFNSVTVGATDSTIPLNFKECASATASYDKSFFQAFTLNSFTSTPSSPNSIIKIINKTVVYSANGTMIPIGTIIETYATGTFTSASYLSLGTTVSLPDGSYELFVSTDSCTYSEDFEIIPAKPFVYSEAETGTLQCGAKSGVLDKDGNIVINSDPVTTAPLLTYEQNIQVSNDSGTTWLDPITFSGGTVYWPVSNPGVMSTSSFAANIDAGTMIRNCLKPVGSATPVKCDTKTLPTPVLQIDSGSNKITLSNTTVETNDCYSSANDSYELSLYAYDSSGKIVEFMTTPPWKPATANADISAAGSEISSIVSLGANGYELNYDVSLGTLVNIVAGELKITHAYDCPGTNLDTNLSAVGNNFAYQIDNDSAFNSGTSLSLQSSMISPAIADYIVDYYNGSSGDLAVTFGAGASYSVPSGHYPSDTDSSIPLVGGQYFPVITTAGNIEPVAPVCIETWDICTNRATVNYEGFSNSGSFNIDVPVPNNLAEIQSIFSTYAVADQALLKDCNGNTVFDSTMTSIEDQKLTTDVTSTLPAPGVASDFSCEKATLELASGGTPAQITIYDLELGCCESGSCTRQTPNRDPYISQAYTSANVCAWQIIAHNPFVTKFNSGYNGINPSNVCYREHLEKNQPPACLFSNEDTPHYSNLLSGSCPGDAESENICIDFTLAADRTHTKVGNIVTISFANTSAYNAGKAFFNTLNSKIPVAWGGDYDRILFYQNRSKVSACVDDGNKLGSFNLAYAKNLAVFDEVNEKIVMDFNGVYPVDPADCCIDSTLNDSDLADLWMSANAKTFFSNDYRVHNRYPGTYKVNASSQTGLAATRNMTFGITNSMCPHTNPEAPYTLVVEDVDDPLSTWKFYKGTEATGTVIQKSASLGGSGELKNFSTISEFCARIIPIHNSEDMILQVIDYTTVTCDLSFYNGLAAESFNDGQELATRLTTLVGTPVDYVPFYNYFSIGVSKPNLRPVVCE